MSVKEPLSNIMELKKQLEKILPEIRQIAENPKRLGAWLEEHSPWHNNWLGREVLGAVSNLSDPYLAGMGLHVDLLNETRAEVTLPERWRNRAEGHVIHVGALTTAAEFVSRLYWERLLNLDRNAMRVKSISSRFLGDAKTDVKAVFNFPENEREAILFRLRSETEVTFPCLVNLFDKDGLLLGEVTIEWHFHQPRALGAGRSQENG